MKNILFLATLLICMSCSSNRDSATSSDIEAVISKFQSAASISNPTDRELRINELWDSLTVNNSIPLTEDTLALFLYRGNAESVRWNGDFNGWSRDERFRNEGGNISGTDIWFLKQEFPSDARLDYKITIDGEQWILDPANPHQQWSGFGPNSELRMPDWQPEPLTEIDPEIPSGILSSHKEIQSASMGYSIRYRVYTPPGYEELQNLPVLYTTDGQEYSDQKLGAVPAVTNNLIYAQKITPILIVFVEPLNPESTDENRRMEELGTNKDYRTFFAEELIPEIESSYSVGTNPGSRAILGTSLGGLNATYFGFSAPAVFGYAGIQSPAYWYRDQIFDIVSDFKGTPPKLYITSGTINDGNDEALRMKGIFERQNFPYQYMEVQEGHSWGAWRAQIDDILIHFFGN